MDETILFPSPNWFQVSGLAVTNDGWLVYGGPSKSLCVLEPVPADYNGVIEGSRRFRAHVLNRAHPDKIVSVDISPEWPEKRLLLTGSAGGSVKQWNLQWMDHQLVMKSTFGHDAHTKEKEDIVGVGYSDEVCTVSVGSFGNIVKWDLSVNLVKTYSTILKNFRPSCMACSHHIPLQVAIGTKQGVLFVMDLTGPGSILYKIRSHDDEIMNVSWCPHFEVKVEKTLCIYTDSTKRPSGSENETKPKKTSVTDRMEQIRQQRDPEDNDVSGIIRNLPEDSFDSSDAAEAAEAAPEDDMFDIYKDHEADEFGHKKYEPEVIAVSTKDPKEKSENFLAECLKLKEDILKIKSEPEPTIESLVDQLEETDINSEGSVQEPVASCSNKVTDINSEGSVQEPIASCSNKVTDINSEGMVQEPVASCSNEVTNINSEGSVCVVSEEPVASSSKEEEKVEPAPVAGVHVHKHLLATIAKQGGIRIWSKTGRLVSSCALATGGKNHQGRYNKSSNWATLTWCKPNLMLIGDGKNQLLECNPLITDSKNKLRTKVVHAIHKRGLHCVASNAARGALPAAQVAWSSAQDRSLVCYSLRDRQTTTYNTCGGFVYNIQICPYDANKVAISVGDGAVRVWSAEESETEGKLSAGRVKAYWQHVQGKVLTVAWHPTKEDVLAFGTGESRVGVIDASGANEKAARALHASLAGGVYSLCWADRLYAAAKGELVAYSPERPDEPAAGVPVRVEGARWAVSAARARGARLAVGSEAGGVAVLEGGAVLAAAFPFGKVIHTIEWHPTQTSSSDEESPHKNLLAVCSQDKTYTVVVLEFGQKDSGHSLVTWRTLKGHLAPVLQLGWNPHREAYLLSTSIDCTVRVWDVEKGECTAIFAGHGATTLSAAWSARPARATAVLSGGADCCLRLWDTRDHPADRYIEMAEVAKKDKKKKHKEKKQNNPEPVESVNTEITLIAAPGLESKMKVNKRYLLPTISKQLGTSCIKGASAMLDIYKAKKGMMPLPEVAEYGIDYIKMFSNNRQEVEALFNMELSAHASTEYWEPWIALSVFRGYIDDVIQFASEKNILSPFLISLAPGVSFKFWKDTSKLYLSQIDRLAATGEEEKLNMVHNYGGPVFRKVMLQLSLHDVMGAVRTLCDTGLFKEAYFMCRLRYMDDIAEDVLVEWIRKLIHDGLYDVAAMCFIAKGQLLEAATVLGRCRDQESLSLASELARAAGQTILSENIADRTPRMGLVAEPAQLPSRVELLAREFLNAEDPEAAAAAAAVSVAIAAPPAASSNGLGDGDK